MKTITSKMIELLSSKEMNAGEISYEMGIQEEKVQEHLSVLSRILDSCGRKLQVRPSRCLVCGYVSRGPRYPALFRRCQQCRDEPVSRPVYWVSDPKE